MAAVKIMDQEAVRRAILRMAHEILEKNKDAENLALIGIRTRGVFLAQRISRSDQGHRGGGCADGDFGYYPLPR